MRFAIALLSLICIASVIGTVLTQRQPLTNYVNQFGPFWSDLFGRLDLFTVYSAPWFLLILAFLVLSTSLCIARQAPKIARDWRDAKLKIRAQSLQAYRHHAAADWPLAPQAARDLLSARLAHQGWTPKQDARSDGTLLAARKGKVNKLGYLGAHGAIVLICIGGLLDGDLVVRAAMALQGKQLYTGSGLVGEQHLLGDNNPSFRANLFVPEGSKASTARIDLPGGLVLQQLPFELELKKFVVEYYETGMPKLFASDVVLIDGDERREARIEVNKPLIHKGLAIYQSSFEDGGSELKLRLEPLTAGTGTPLSGRVGAPAQPLPGSDLQLELTELRVINVEDFGKVRGASEAASAPDAASGPGLSRHLGSGAKPPGEKSLRNIGPSLTYRLRDRAGQAREFHQYMVATELDGVRVFLHGVRDDANAEFRYLRLPADEDDSLQGWLRLRRALADTGLREQAARRYGELASPRPELREQVGATALRTLALFAGAETIKNGAEVVPGGLAALSSFVEQDVPAAERERVSGVLLRILNGSLLELDALARERDKVALPPPDATRQAFMTQAVLSLSDSQFFPAPLLVRLDSFEQRQASVFQVARAPGQKLVYAGAVLLILGVFAMLYIRERRLWVWLAPAAGGTQLMLALSSHRQSLDNDAEFESLKTHLLSPP
jgi:cytochrome c biogenesis protein